MTADQQPQASPELGAEAARAAEAFAAAVAAEAGGHTIEDLAPIAAAMGALARAVGEVAVTASTMADEVDEDGWGPLADALGLAASAADDAARYAGQAAGMAPRVGQGRPITEGWPT